MPDQECRAGDRSYTMEMQKKKVIEGVIVKVWYGWVSVHCWGEHKDVYLESTIGRGGQEYLIYVYVSSGTYSCHQQYMYWAPLSLPIASPMANHCRYSRKVGLGIPETIYVQPWLWVVSTRRKKIWHYQILLLLFLYKMHINCPASLNTIAVFLRAVSRHPGASSALCFSMSSPVFGAFSLSFSLMFSVQIYSCAHSHTWS